MTQEIYSIDFYIAGCNFEFRINDAIVLNYLQGTPLKSEININEWIANGDNYFEIIFNNNQFSDVFDSNFNYTIKLYKRNINQPKSSREEITSFVGTYQEDSEPQSSLSLSKHFQADVPFNKWKWLGSQVITDDFSNKNQIMAIYTEFWQALKSNELEKLLKMTSERTKEMATAYYMTVEDKTAINRESFIDSMNGSNLGMDLYELDFEELDLKLFANNRLACFLDSNGNPPICYVNFELGFANYLPIKLCKINNNFEIIR